MNGIQYPQCPDAPVVEARSNHVIARHGTSTQTVKCRMLQNYTVWYTLNAGTRLLPYNCENGQYNNGSDKAKRLLSPHRQQNVVVDTSNCTLLATVYVAIVLEFPLEHNITPHPRMDGGEPAHHCGTIRARKRTSRYRGISGHGSWLQVHIAGCGQDMNLVVRMGLIGASSCVFGCKPWKSSITDALTGLCSVCTRGVSPEAQIFVTEIQ